MADSSELNAHLSRIQTQWTMVFQAHGDQKSEVGPAQHALMQRYGGAVYRYLLGILRDPHAADELAQEFALRFVRGAFRNADPSRGRFRDFVKRSVHNLVIDHYRRQKHRPMSLPENGPDPAAPEEPNDEMDRQFLDSWRNELLSRAWNRLAEVQEKAGTPFYDVLRLRAEKPDLTSSQMADALSATLEKPVNANWVRQTLLRARAKFVDFLVDEVKSSLKEPSAEQLEDELIELGLMEYCRPDA